MNENKNAHKDIATTPRPQMAASGRLDFISFRIAQKSYTIYKMSPRTTARIMAARHIGKEKRRFIGDQNHTDPTAGVEANKALNEVNKAGTGVIFVDGMDYASFVSSKGYDVIDTAEAYLKRELNKQQ